MRFRVLLLVIIGFQANAQYYIGIKTGINYANQFYTYQTTSNNYGGLYSPSYSPYSNNSTTNTKIEYLGNGLTNLNFGIQTGYAFKRVITLLTELSYMQMGFSSKDDPAYNIKIDYLQWNALVVKLHTGKRKKVQAFGSLGLALGFPVHSVYNIPGTTVANPNDSFEAIKIDKIDMTQYTSSPDASLFIGIGLDIPLGNGQFVIEGRYQGGFINVYKGDFSTNLGETIMNSNLIAQVGYSLFLTKY